MAIMTMLMFVMLMMMELMMLTWGTGNTLANWREGGNTTPGKGDHDEGIMVMGMIRTIVILMVLKI